MKNLKMKKKKKNLVLKSQNQVQKKIQKVEMIKEKKM